MPSADEDRFLELVEPHLPALYRLAYRLYRNRSDADDLFQEACMRAFERIEKLAEVTARRAWLMRVAYNLYIDRQRAATRGRLESLTEHPQAERVVDTSPGPDQHVELDELMHGLGRAWLALTPEQQGLLSLSSEGHTLAELVEITGIPLGALKGRLHRARVRLGKQLRIQEQRPQRKAAFGDA